MRIEVFSICDAATAVAGKLNMLGVFDTIWTKKIPVVYPHCAVTLRVRFESDEQGQHKVMVSFVDLDGNHIIQPANGTIAVNFSEKTRSRAANLILNIQNLKLQKYGEYAIDLAIDNRREKSLPLFVREPSVKS